MAQFSQRSGQSADALKKKLEGVFNSYAKGGSLNNSQLREAFEHLGAKMPHKETEEAMNYADKNKDNVIRGDEEMNSLVQYALQKGYGEDA
ncbi:hypothetical protein QQP08_018288 [Theobroma cacao]|uniref:Calcium-binding EF-hand family protein n=1 Tax=Theobroma cacao TaxID=3641 RepID=A0A061GJM3_THECC|nr:Uncharacterized protein TCM_029151 [Theobroma cacao]WRX25801.1 hypothetical protein QQP08_018288 [Theobroma cacao]